MSLLTPIKIELPANLQLSEGIRELVANILRVAGFDQTWVHRLVLVVDEVFMNAVKYGSVENKNQVHINFYPKTDHLYIEIEDEGAGEKKVEIEELRGIISANEENNDLTKSSGRGLSMIVTSWTDRYEIERSDRGGTKICLTKYFATATPPTTPTDTTKSKKPVVQKKAASAEDILVYELKKSFDIHNEADKTELLSAIEQSQKNLVILDFTNITYINSVFIGLITKIFNKLNLAQGMLALCNLSNQIEDTLNLVGLSNILILATDRADAQSQLLSR